MSNYQLGIALIIAGLVACLAAWTFFRHKEHKFLTFAPFSEAHQYMRQPGGIIWWTGIALLVLGIINCWAGR
ncbi:MAG: hypothetical protein QM776_15045 [Rhodocyclaceae bacterium]